MLQMVNLIQNRWNMEQNRQLPGSGHRAQGVGRWAKSAKWRE